MAEVCEFFKKRDILTDLVEKKEEERDREAGSPGLRAFAAATGSEVFDKLHAGFAGDLAKQAAFFQRRLEAGGKTRADEMTEVEATVAWALDKV